MPRSYLRLDPNFYDRKVSQGYPLPAIAALVGVFCQAEYQPERGHFRNRRLLAALLGSGQRWMAFLIEHRDLVELPDHRIYVVGWREWQEGDWKVGERVQRIRAARAARNGPANGAKRDAVTVETVDKPSDGGRHRSYQGSESLGGGGGVSKDGAPLRAPRNDKPTRDEAKTRLSSLHSILADASREVRS